MDRRWLLLAGVVAFSVALAIVVGWQLASLQALSVALGVGIGTTVGVSAGLLMLRGRIQSPEHDHPGMTTIIMPEQQAQTLIKMLNTRQQADPDAFPMVADTERRFSAVGGASFDETDE
jgi:hypothetical protein